MPKLLISPSKDTITCGKRKVSGGTCSRPVAYPGAFCGVDHGTSSETLTSTPISEENYLFDPITQNSGVVNGKTLAEWELEAELWEEMAQEIRTKDDDEGAWPIEVQASLYEKRAEICRNKGTHVFTGLYDATSGDRANAKLYESKGILGNRWIVFKPKDHEQRFPHHEAFEADNTKEMSGRGYEERDENSRAWARIKLSADTMSPESATVEIYRLDHGKPYTSTPIENPDITETFSETQR